MRLQFKATPNSKLNKLIAPNILNTQLNVASRIVSKLLRGDLFSDLYHLDGTASCEPFNERFENSFEIL